MEKSVIGLDLGGDTSLMVRGDGEILRNELGGHSTRTLATYGSEQRFLGEPAVNQLSSNLGSAVLNLPYLVGRTSAEVSGDPLFESCAAALGDADVDGKLALRLPDHVVPAAAEGRNSLPLALVLSSFVKKLVGQIEGDEQREYAVAVPNAYSASQFASLRDAMRIAGLPVRRFPLAADCLVACLEKKHPFQGGEGKPFKVVLALDIGKTSTSAVVFKQYAKELGRAAVVTAARHEPAGCQHMDMALVSFLKDKFASDPKYAKSKIDVPRGSKAEFRLLNGCEKLRKLLSTMRSATVTVESLAEDTDVRVDASQEDLLQANADYFARLRAMLSDLRDASQVDIVEIVGGGTRMQVVKDALRDIFGEGTPVGQKLDDASIAYGAALLAMPSPDKVPDAAGENADGADADGANADGANADGANAEGENAEGEQAEGEKAAAGADENADAAGGEEGAGGKAAEEAEVSVTAAMEASLLEAPEASLSEEAVASLRALDAVFEERDAECVSKQEALNALESFVLSMRSAKSGDFGELIDASQLDPLLAELDDWQWTDEAASASAAAVHERVAEARRRVDEEVCVAWRTAKEQKKAETEQRLKESSERAAKERAAEGDDDDHDTRKLKFSDRMRHVERNKAEGTELYKGGNWRHAAARYNKALSHTTKFYDCSPQQLEEVNAAKVSLQLNMAQCYLKLENYEKVEWHATNAIDAVGDGPVNVKAHYRRALARQYLKKFDDAKRDLDLIPAEKQDKAIDKLKARVNAAIQRQKDKERKFAQRMFS